MHSPEFVDCLKQINTNFKKGAIISSQSAKLRPHFASKKVRNPTPSSVVLEAKQLLLVSFIPLLSMASRSQKQLARNDEEKTREAGGILSDLLRSRVDDSISNILLVCLHRP